MIKDNGNITRWLWNTDDAYGKGTFTEGETYSVRIESTTERATSAQGETFVAEKLIFVKFNGFNEADEISIEGNRYEIIKLDPIWGSKAFSHTEILVRKKR